MIELNRLSYPPLRQGLSNACLLASYGAALYPFTRIKEIAYFIELCNLVDFPVHYEGDALLFPSQHVDQRIGVIESGSGYDWIAALHNNCPSNSFAMNRSKVVLERPDRVKAEHLLSEYNCTAIFSINNSFINFAHSVCVIKHPLLGFIIRDSAQPYKQPESCIDLFGDNLDELIFRIYQSTDFKVGEFMVFQELNS